MQNFFSKQRTLTEIRHFLRSNMFKDFSGNITHLGYLLNEVEQRWIVFNRKQYKIIENNSELSLSLTALFQNCEIQVANIGERHGFNIQFCTYLIGKNTSTQQAKEEFLDESIYE